MSAFLSYQPAFAASFKHRTVHPQCGKTDGFQKGCAMIPQCWARRCALDLLDICAKQPTGSIGIGKSPCLVHLKDVRSMKMREKAQRSPGNPSRVSTMRE
jgi:hypothetical protein